MTRVEIILLCIINPAVPRCDLSVRTKGNRRGTVPVYTWTTDAINSGGKEAVKNGYILKRMDKELVRALARSSVSINVENETRRNSHGAVPGAARSRRTAIRGHYVIRVAFFYMCDCAVASADR